MSLTYTPDQSELVQSIESRFELIDQWIIYYTPTANSSLERILCWFTLLQKHIEEVRARGKEPVLMLNLEEVTTASKREVRIALADGLAKSGLKFIATFGIKSFLMRMAFKFVIKAGSGIESRLFTDKHSALEFLNKWSDHIIEQ